MDGVILKSFLLFSSFVLWLFLPFVRLGYVLVLVISISGFITFVSFCLGVKECAYITICWFVCL